MLGNIALCFIYFVAFKEWIIFLLWKCHVKSIGLHMGETLIFHLCLCREFDGTFCIHIAFSLDSFLPTASQLTVTQELMFIDKW